MPRYFMHLAYRGAPFHGWQIQPNAVTVQQTLEDALSTILRQPIGIVGAGRTDTGVNARCMVAHFDFPAELAETERVVRAVNSIVGRDIAVYSIQSVHSDAHARFDAVSRTYHYYITTKKSPFLYPFSWFTPNSLDFNAMNHAAELLREVDDFSSFSKLHTDVKTNICDVTEAEWRQVGPNEYVFVITADRFLRNMVRAVVGTLVDVGRKKIDIEEFRRIIESKDRCAAGTSMPAQALFLWDVKYPYIEFESGFTVKFG